MQIIQVKTPIFKIKDKEIYVKSGMYKNLIQFQEEINQYEKEGVTKCYFYSLHTQHEPEPCGTIYWIRCRFVK